MKCFNTVCHLPILTAQLYSVGSPTKACNTTDGFSSKFYIDILLTILI